MKRFIAAGVVAGMVAYVALYAADADRPDSAITRAAMSANQPQDVSVAVGNIHRGSADIRIKNTSGTMLDSVFMHCTFRAADGARIDDVPLFITGLAVNDVANERARMPNSIQAHNVDCRVDHARKG